MAQKKFRKANSANDGAEWWIADSVADLPINHNPAIKVGDMAVIKPENAVAGDEYDTYMFQYVTGISGAKHWVLYIDNDTPAAGEVNTASNVGIGEGQSFKAKVGTDLQFRTLKQGANVTISTVGDEVTISAVGPDGGEDNSLSNEGAGEGEVALPKIPGNPVLPIKTLKAGTNMSIVNGANEIVFNANVPAVTHPVRLEECEGKIYIVGTFGGNDYAVEATAFDCTPPVCFQPTAQAQGFLGVTLQPSFSVTVNALDADMGSFDNGSNPSPGIASYLISKDDVTYTPSIEFTCDDQGPQVAYFKVTNNCGNTSDSIQIFIDVQDNMGVCEFN